MNYFRNPSALMIAAGTKPRVLAFHLTMHGKGTSLLDPAAFGGWVYSASSVMHMNEALPTSLF